MVHPADGVYRREDDVEEIEEPDDELEEEEAEEAEADSDGVEVDADEEDADVEPDEGDEADNNSQASLDEKSVEEYVATALSLSSDTDVIMARITKDGKTVYLEDLDPKVV